MNYNAGTGATLVGKSLEHFLYLLIKFGQEMEGNKAKNTSNQNLITSGTSDDETSFTATLSGFPLRLGNDGKHEAIDYLSLQATDFTNGTGGDYESVSTWTNTIWLVLLKLHEQQLLSTEELDNFSFDVEGAESLTFGVNATFSAEINFTLLEERVKQPDGTSSYESSVKTLFA
ncbi:MAG: hypothetical protein F6J93_21985 [Oscillatoria sp. SIO1A7]|nr:hypothetical protein [Oscillatoria sp. SIO1A7]